MLVDDVIADDTFQANRLKFVSLVRQAMAEQHLSNYRLAQMSGIAESTVRKILKESGKSESIGPHPQVVKAICRVLNLDAIAVFQLLDYLPSSLPSFFSDGAERIALRFDRLPLDKQKILVDLLDSLEKSASLDTPDESLQNVLEAARRLQKQYPMFNRKSHVQEKTESRIFNVGIREQLLNRFQVVFRDFRDDRIQIDADCLDRMLQHPFVIMILQILVPQKNAPGALEKLHWLCFGDKAYGSASTELSDAHQQGFRALWKLLVKFSDQQT